MRHPNNKNIDLPNSSEDDGFVYISRKSATIPVNAKYSTNEPNDLSVLRYGIYPMNGGLCLSIQFSGGKMWHAPSAAQTREIANKIGGNAYSFGGGDIGGIQIDDIENIDSVIRDLNYQEFEVSGHFAGGGHQVDAQKVKILCDSMYRNPRTGKPY
jgi:hypothetical protein